MAPTGLSGFALLEDVLESLGEQRHRRSSLFNLLCCWLYCTVFPVLGCTFPLVSEFVSPCKNMKNAHLKTGILVKPFWVFQYALLLVIAVAIGPLIFSSNWVSSSDFHACIEMSSSLIAITVGIAGIVYFFSMRSTFFLIVGLGFFISGSEDLVHGFLSFERLWTAGSVDFSRAIPGTYATGRLLLGFFVIAAILFEKTISDTAQQKKQALIFISSSIILSSVMTWVAYLLPLPQFIFPDRLISRPVDFISAIIFLIAFGLGYKKLLVHRHIFTHFLLLSMLFNAFGQIYMSFSKQLYDIYFDVAHVANILSYFMPVVGLLAYLVEQHRALGVEQEKTQKQKLALVSVIEGTNAGTWEWNIPNGAAIINERSANIIGYTLEEISPVNNNTWQKFCHADDLKKSEELLHKHFSGELEYYECEIRMLHKNGSWVWVLTRGRVSLWDGDGVALLMSGTHQDITKRKQAEEELIKHREHLEELVDKRTLALTESESTLRTLIDTTGTAYHVIDEHGNILEANQEYVRLSGHRKFTEIKGHNILEWTAEHDRVRNTLEVARCYRQGTIRNLEIDYVDSEEHFTPVEINASVFKKKDQTLILAMIRDITERKKAEAALAAEKELLFVTLRSIGDAVITTDTEGRITSLNRVAEKLTGWVEEEARGQSSREVFNIISEKNGERCASPVQMVMEQGSIIGLASHTALIAKDGSRRVIADSGAPIRDRNSKIVGVVVVFRDISNEQRMEEELLKVKKLESVGVLAGGIAHDFNNILAAILGNIELAGMSIDSASEAQPLLLEAKKASIRAKDLTQQLLTFAKGGDPVKTTASLGNIIVDSANFVLHGSSVVCNYNIPKDLWHVDVDTGQISQVIQNIIINADQAMPDGGVIKVSCENITDIEKENVALPGQKFIKIAIADTGSGIPQKHIDRIFDPYFSTKQTGSGLGLAICHSIINKHDGNLSVQSTADKGTTFTIYLPVSTQTAHESGRFKQDIVEAECKASIMVMDDDVMVLDIAKRMLERFGHKVVLAENGQEAIELYREHFKSDHPVDAIIMDLTIPGGMGGKDAVQEILRINPEAKVVVASGYSNDPVMARYHDYGFNASISKPFMLADLRKVINSVLK